jgi:hypothetical protein
LAAQRVGTHLLARQSNLDRLDIEDALDLPVAT